VDTHPKLQRYTDEAYPAVVRAVDEGRVRIPHGVPRDTVIGQRTDRIVQTRLKRWIRREGVAEGPGEAVQVNRWLRDPGGSGAYRIPDLRVPDADVIMDGTIGYKWNNTPQITDFYQYSAGSHTIIVRPTELGGSYSLIPPQ